MNKNLLKLSLLVLSPLLAFNAFAACNEPLDFEGKKLHSNDTLNFCDAFSNKVLLVVNTASECGFTPQFEGLEELYNKYKDQNFEIVGFPSNDFNQEHKEEEKTANVCYLNYGVTFNMMSTSSVKGENANAFYQYLISKTGKQPNWNFNKYLISADGASIQYFGSAVTPLNSDLEKAIESQVK